MTSRGVMYRPLARPSSDVVGPPVGPLLEPTRLTTGGVSSCSPRRSPPGPGSRRASPLRARDDVRVIYPVTVAVVRSVVHDEGRVADHGVRPRRVGEDQADIAPVSLKVVPHEDVSTRLPREYAAARGTGDHVRAKGAAQHECCQKGVSREPDAVDCSPCQL